MYPRALVERCISEGLDMIAICDHNASENVSYVIRAAQGKPLAVIPGMEITSREEVHILALFDNLEGLRQVQETVYGSLEGLNDEDAFGCQAIVNEMDEVEGINERLLIGATGLSLGGILEVVRRREDWPSLRTSTVRASASSANWDSYRGDIRFDALEISRATGLKRGRQRFPEYAGYAFHRKFGCPFFERYRIRLHRISAGGAEPGRTEAGIRGKRRPVHSQRFRRGRFSLIRCCSWLCIYWTS